VINIRRSVVTATVAAVLGIAGVIGLAAPSSAQPVSTARSVAVAEPASQHWGQRLPSIAVNWAAAWNSGYPQRLAALFVNDGARYTDHAFDVTFTGRDGVAEWLAATKQAVTGASVKVSDAFVAGDHAVIFWTFSGKAVGAAQSFSVPVVTVLQLRGHEIVTDDDFYSLAEVDRQSGLPAGASHG
jgi:hypothetical protein